MFGANFKVFERFANSRKVWVFCVDALRACCRDLLYKGSLRHRQTLVASSFSPIPQFQKYGRRLFIVLKYRVELTTVSIIRLDG